MRPRPQTVYRRTARRGPGTVRFTWAPPATTPPRTYVVRLTVGGHTFEPKFPTEAPTTPVIRVLGVEAGFLRSSYAPRSVAELGVATDAPRFTLQFFRSGPEGRVPAAPTFPGVPVGEPTDVDWSSWRSRRRALRVWIGDWPTGVYFARLTTPDGRLGYAPVVVRPTRLGGQRAAVVMPTHTWQAYNFRDDDGNGYGDSWYVTWSRPRVRLGRPYLSGMPPFYRTYDLPFLRWLAAHNAPVDYLAQEDVEHARPEELDAYGLIVFPGHHEYVTLREYDAIQRYRDRGRNLMFLSANNLFWRVEHRGDFLVRTRKWRDLGRPEASLVGVQYTANDRGERHGEYILRATQPTSWIFEGTGLQPGDAFGRGGIEIDSKAASSPRDTQVLAEIPNLFGRGRSAQMTYYETRAGAKVFAAGAFTLAGRALRLPEKRILENLWKAFTAPEETEGTPPAAAGGTRR
jgi:hypothetical protein